MKCQCCDIILTDYEATRRNGITNAFIDLCLICDDSEELGIPVIDRPDLLTKDISDD
jgi:hypothetical protein